jgi:hypothetical protein
MRRNQVVVFPHTCTSLAFSEKYDLVSAKPLLIGSIPIAASNLFNNLEPTHKTATDVL